jgi:hypothetical protein
MSNNTVVYPFAFKAGNISFDIIVKSEAKLPCNNVDQIVKICEAILSTYYNRPLDKITLSELIKTNIRYDKDAGATINGDISTKKITETFLETFKDPSYEGLYIAEKEPTIEGAIKDFYDLQTRVKIEGTVDPAPIDTGTWAVNGMEKGFNVAYNGLSSVLGGAYKMLLAPYRYFFPEIDILKHEDLIKKEENKQHLIDIYEFFEGKKDKKELSDNAKKFYNDILEPYIKKKLLELKADPDNDQNIFKYFLEEILKLANITIPK